RCPPTAIRTALTSAGRVVRLRGRLARRAGRMDVLVLAGQGSPARRARSASTHLYELALAGVCDPSDDPLSHPRGATLDLQRHEGKRARGRRLAACDHALEREDRLLSEVERE